MFRINSINCRQKPKPDAMMGVIETSKPANAYSKSSLRERPEDGWNKQEGINSFDQFAAKQPTSIHSSSSRTTL
jgi:hypothetical protein